MRNSKNIEKIVKGFSNHWRIDIIDLLSNNPNLALFEIAARLKMNNKTASEHVRRLAIAGLVTKKYKKSSVLHSLTPRARTILKFLRILE